MKVYRSPLFYLGILLAVGLVFSIGRAAFTEPSNSFPGSAPAAPLDTSSLTQTKDGNLIINGSLGVGMTPGKRLDVFGPLRASGVGEFGSLDVSGDVQWTGSLTSGAVPWGRLTGFPGACPSGQAITALGSTITCAAAGAPSQWTDISGGGIYYNGGNVGIGTTSLFGPSGYDRFLEIRGDAPAIVLNEPSGALQWGFVIGVDNGVLNFGQSYPAGFLNPVFRIGNGVFEVEGSALFNNNASFLGAVEVFSSWPTISGPYRTGQKVGVGTLTTNLGKHDMCTLKRCRTGDIDDKNSWVTCDVYKGSDGTWTAMVDIVNDDDARGEVEAYCFDF